jgi:uncharacterized membrane protein
MTEDEVNREIDNYLAEVSRVLPDSFETDDLIEEIRTHILESLQDKKEQHSDAGRLSLVREVLNALGDPEEIAVEWGKAQTTGEEEKNRRSNLYRTIARQAFAILVVIAAAYFISLLPNTIVDFWTALTILMVFVVAEYFLRTWQKGEVSRIEANADKKR